MHNIIEVKIVNSLKYLAYCLGGVLLGELAVLADPVEEFSASRQLGDYVVLVLLNKNNQYKR